MTGATAKAQAGQSNGSQASAQAAIARQRIGKERVLEQAHTRMPALHAHHPPIHLFVRLQVCQDSTHPWDAMASQASKMSQR